MIPSLDDLRVVPLECLILHEAHDARRLASLRERIAAEGVQRNPVIVAPHETNYLVLDGAHRVHAMREIGCRLILVQVVEPPSAAESWGHLIHGVEIPKLRNVDSAVVSDEAGDSPVATVQMAGGATVYIGARETGLGGVVRALWSMQELYSNGDVVRRVDPDGPVEIGEGEALIHYRTFTVEELVEIVRCGTVLPAGITRFRLRERVLGVRFPLEHMRDGDAEAGNKELRRFVEEQWKQNRIRYYGEPVVLFE